MMKEMVLHLPVMWPMKRSLSFQPAPGVVAALPSTKPRNTRHENSMINSAMTSMADPEAAYAVFLFHVQLSRGS
jgi:hypothetical protein